MYSSFVISCHLYFTYKIGLIFGLFFLFLLLFGVCIMGIVGYILVGNLILLFMHHHLCMYFLWSLWYVFLHFFSFSILFYSVFLFPGTYIPHVLLFPNCVTFTHN